MDGAPLPVPADEDDRGPEADRFGADPALSVQVPSPTAASTATSGERRRTRLVAVGGRYDLTNQTSVHLGFFTSQSPVGDESVFSVVDLYGVSTGVSLNWAHISTSPDPEPEVRHEER